MAVSVEEDTAVRLEKDDGPQRGTAGPVPDPGRIHDLTWRLRYRLPLALVAGLALALAFPPIGRGWLLPFAVAALTWLCSGTGIRLRGAALVGMVFGLAFFALLEQWMRVPGIDAWLAVVVIQSFFTAALGAGIALLTRLRGWPVWVAALWVLFEYARAHIPFGGFPWGRLAYGLVDTPLAATSALGGAAFVTFVAALAANLALWALLASPARIWQRAVAFVAAVGIALGGLLVPLPTDAPKSSTVAVVQGNIPGKGLEFLGRARTVTNNHLAATIQLMRGVDSGTYPKPDFVVWPENSTDIDPFEDPITFDVVDQAAKIAGVPILVGAILDGPGPDHRRTTGMVWDPEKGPGEVYVKQHPVPFGEYIPMRDLLLPYIDRLQLVGRQTYAGDKPGNMQIAGVHIGEVICFEIAYDEIVRQVDTSQVLVVQSNNATFQQTGMPEQQFAITRLRAIEYGRSALVATPSGISGVIAPDGSIVAQSKERTREIFVEKVPLRTTRTLAAILGPVPEIGLASVGFLALVVAVVARRMARRRTREATS
ncbi:apolipoprotein N-acyltransferase [Flindersiella endophytica]